MMTLPTGGLHVRPSRQQGGHGVCPYASTMSGWLHLLRIDLKRGGGMWIVPFGILFAWLTLRNALTPGVAVWPEITEAISMMSAPLIILAVAFGGIAGGRERRLETGELVSGTSMVAWHRHLSLAASVFLWALAAYAAFAGSLLAYGALRATWGGPEWGVIVVPIPILALGASFGVLVGRGIRDRTAPVLAVALFFLFFVMAFMPSMSTGPLSVFSLNAWFHPVVENPPARPFTVISQLAWGIGLTGIVIGIGILWERRTVLASAQVVVSTIVAVIAATTIIGAGYRAPTSFGASSGGGDLHVPAISVCDESGAITVCVHPAYEGMLRSLADDVNAYLGPAAGLPGIVTDMYLSSGNGQHAGWSPQSGLGYASIDLAFRDDVEDAVATSLWPMGLMTVNGDGGVVADTVQYVVMTALAREIGVDEWPEWFYRVPDNADDPALQAAIDRFAALPPDEQRSWLEANWNDLSQGTLTLEDLP